MAVGGGWVVPGGAEWLVGGWVGGCRMVGAWLPDGTWKLRWRDKSPVIILLNNIQ